MNKSSSEYVKYLADRVIGYMDKSKEEKLLIKQKAKAQKEQWLIRWFGVGGAYIYYSRRRKHQEDDGE